MVSSNIFLVNLVLLWVKENLGPSFNAKFKSGALPGSYQHLRLLAVGYDYIGLYDSSYHVELYLAFV
jgi:hypothetical protein